jgi:hypothetical protein
MLLIAIFAALVLIRYAAVLLLASLIVRPVLVCPACLRSATVAVRQVWLRPIARHFEWRWCPSCGWQALARRHTHGADQSEVLRYGRPGHGSAP